MIKRIALFLLVASLAVFTASAIAQQVTTVKGVCKDENGKPIAGATVQLDNLETGRKTTLKTDNHGLYYSLGAISGTYKISLIGTDGSVIFFLNNAPLNPGAENIFDIDLAKQKAEAAKESGATAERFKEIEKAKKENEKIKNINALLTQAIQQKKDKQYDQAVATLEQAAAQDQTHDVVYSSLADAYVQVKKFPEAETAYSKAIALAPANSKFLGSYHAGLSLALLQQGKTGPGMAECDKVGQLDPASAGQCFYNEGAILTNQGKADDANLAFDKAIAADPTRPDPYYQKGVNLLGKMTVGKDGKPIAAPGTAEAFNKYLELAPDGPNAQTAKDLLASIGAPVQTSFGAKKGSKK